MAVHSVSLFHPFGSLAVLPGKPVQFASVHPEAASNSNGSELFAFDKAVYGGSANGKISCHFVNPVIGFLRKTHSNNPPSRG